MKKLLLLGSLVFSISAFAQTSTSDAGDIYKIKQETSEVKIIVYPNPAREVFFIKYDETEGPIEQVMLLSHDGRKIRTYEKPKPEKFFIADLDAGVYTVWVQIADKFYVDKLTITDKLP